MFEKKVKEEKIHDLNLQLQVTNINHFGAKSSLKTERLLKLA